MLDLHRARAGVTGAVRDALLRRPGTPPTLPEVAGESGMSIRTLSRRLDAEHSSFRALAEEVRQAQAQAWLTTGMTTDQVAQRLGYAETSSFIRAFRRRTGHAPQAYCRERETSVPTLGGREALR